VTRPDVRWLAGLWLLASCGRGDDGAPKAGIDLTALDRSTPPCRDFYQFACGGWLASHPVGRDGAYISTSLDPYYEQVEPIRQLIAEAEATPEAQRTPEMQLIGAFHRSCMTAPSDLQARNRLRAIAQTVDSISSMEDLARVLAAQAELGTASLFWMYVQVDRGDPTRYALAIDAGGIELPDRNYYLEERHAAVRQRYQQHIGALANLVGVSIDPVAVLAIETALAKADLTPLERRDLRALHNPMSLDELTALTPRFPWPTYLIARGFPTSGTIDVVAPDYVRAIDHLLALHSLEQIKHYLRWQIIEDKAGWLDQPVADEEFAFHQRVIFGVAEPSPRHWTCLARTRGELGFLLARSYVPRFVDPNTRVQAAAILHEVRGAVRRRLTELPWLDEATRAEAIAKLDRVAEKVSHPDVWPPIPNVEPRGSWLDLMLGLRQARHAFASGRLPLPVDRNEWWMSPTEVNAYYSPWLNEIVFPAAILRPPFFDPAADPVANFGAIGSVMGHEITHAFDDQGRQFDGEGKLRNWWSPAAEASFRDRAACMVREAARHQPLPGRSVDGIRTLGENIADLGGVGLAFDAWSHSGAAAAPAGGFDGAQQFFIAFAQRSCTQMTPEALATSLEADSHAPAKVRVNSPLSQLEGFAQAFQCPVDSPMRVRPACEVW
jgi:putative endopeptidase